MEIVTEDAHRMLAYIEAVNRQGAPLTGADLDAYASGWKRKEGLALGSGELSRAMFLASQTLVSMGTRYTEEKMSDYLKRVRWVSADSGVLMITDIGKAVLREANSPAPDNESGSTLEVVIDPENPFAYAQLMGRITAFESCMIVDPYIDQDQLLTLASFTTVTRILTSNKDSTRKVPAFGLVLDAAHHLEIRMVEQKHLHDRLVLPSDGRALMLGSSLNSIARRFGVGTPLEAATSGLALSHYEKLWSTGKAVERKALPPTAAVTAATVDDGTGS